MFKMVTLVLVMILSTSTIFAQNWEVPKQLGLVNDFANVLSDEQKMNFETKLAASYQRNNILFIIVTLESSLGYSTSMLAGKLNEAWGLKLKTDYVYIKFIIKKEGIVKGNLTRKLQAKLPATQATWAQSAEQLYRDNKFGEALEIEIDGFISIFDVLPKN